MNIEIELAAIDGTSKEIIEIDDSIYNEFTLYAQKNKCTVEDIINYILLREFENTGGLTYEK